MKRIPSQFDVVGHTIKVQVIPKSRWPLKDCVAIFKPHENLILVMRHPTAKQTRQAFWHEAVHAMLHSINHKLYHDEAFVDNMGGLIAQIMETAA